AQAPRRRHGLRLPVPCPPPPALSHEQVQQQVGKSYFPAQQAPQKEPRDGPRPHVPCDRPRQPCPRRPERANAPGAPSWPWNEPVAKPHTRNAARLIWIARPQACDSCYQFHFLSRQASFVAQAKAFPPRDVSP